MLHRRLSKPRQLACHALEDAFLSDQLEYYAKRSECAPSSLLPCIGCVGVLDKIFMKTPTRGHLFNFNSAKCKNRTRRREGLSLTASMRSLQSTQTTPFLWLASLFSLPKKRGRLETWKQHAAFPSLLFLPLTTPSLAFAHAHSALRGTFLSCHLFPLPLPNWAPLLSQLPCPPLHYFSLPVAGSFFSLLGTDSAPMPPAPSPELTAFHLPGCRCTRSRKVSQEWLFLYSHHLPLCPLLPHVSDTDTARKM